MVGIRFKIPIVGMPDRRLKLFADGKYISQPIYFNIKRRNYSKRNICIFIIRLYLHKNCTLGTSLGATNTLFKDLIYIGNAL